MESISNPIKSNCDVYMVILGKKALSQVLIIANLLRIKRGLSVITEPSRRSIKVQMKEANRQNANYSIIMGDDEIDKGIASVKNMNDGSQQEIELDKILDFFNKK